MIENRKKCLEHPTPGKRKVSIVIVAILFPSQSREYKSRNTSGTLESRPAGVGVLDSGGSCSHIYYPGSRTGTNEFLIIRVGARSIPTIVASLCADCPFEATCYIDSFCFFHRSALYEKYGVTPDVKDFLVRRKEIGVPSLFLSLLLPAA